jgi:hypothetical protein
MIDSKIMQEWLKYAQSDMFAARYMFYDVNPKQTEISVFHCQQCAEKSLKAYLVAHDMEVKTAIDKAQQIFDFCTAKVGVITSTKAHEKDETGESGPS